MPSWIITALCGFRDALSPCALTTVFGLLFFVSELRKRRISSSWFAALFIVISFISFLAFCLGVFLPTLYSDGFYSLAQIIYLVIGCVFVIAGFIHLRDWWMLKQGKSSSLFFAMVSAEDQEDLRKGGRPNFLLILLITVTAVVLSALTTVWPMDPYVLFYSTYLLVPGKTVEAYVMMFVYCVSFIVPLAGSFVFISSGLFSKWVREIPSFVKITMSALTFAVGTGLIYIFH